MDKLKILILEGTTRPLRESLHVARFVEKIGKQISEIDVTLVDPSELKLPYDGNDEDNKDPRYSELTLKADGFLIVTPEYNHSFPGSLKRLLDSELKNYIHKPVAFAGVSSGHWGGIRAIESLVPAVREMGLVATFTDAYFPNVQELFDEQGLIKPDQEELYTKGVNAVYAELIWMANALKAARDGVECPPKPTVKTRRQ